MKAFPVLLVLAFAFVLVAAGCCHHDTVSKDRGPITSDEGKALTQTNPSAGTTGQIDPPAVKESDKVRSPSSTSPQRKSVQCMGTTKKGKRCSRMTTDPSGYCWQHK
jgi:hypothetical protein